MAAIGYTTIGSSTKNCGTPTGVENEVGLLITIPAAGVISKITAYVNMTSGTENISCTIYSGSAGSLGSAISTTTSHSVGTAAWVDFIFTDPVVVSPTTYWLQFFGWGGDGPGTAIAQIAYDSGGSTNSSYQRDDFDDPSYGTDQYSMYATYMDTNTYYFDGSDVSATETGVGTSWSNITNADDGDVDTDASVTLGEFADSKELVIEGTNAPSSGGEILQVRARIHGHAVGGSEILTDITTNADDEELYSNIPANLSEGWSDYYILSTPTGGWTWDKIQSLESRSRGNGGFDGATVYFSRIEIEVTSEISGTTTSTSTSSTTSTSSSTSTTTTSTSSTTSTSTSTTTSSSTTTTSTSTTTSSSTSTSTTLSVTTSTSTTTTSTSSSTTTSTSSSTTTTSTSTTTSSSTSTTTTSTSTSSTTSTSSSTTTSTTISVTTSTSTTTTSTSTSTTTTSTSSSTSTSTSTTTTTTSTSSTTSTTTTFPFEIIVEKIDLVIKSERSIDLIIDSEVI